MKKFFIALIALSLFCLSGCGNNNETRLQEENSYSSERTITMENTNIDNSTDDNNDSKNNNTETELSSISTKIYTPNDSGRQNNIRLTCSKLNGTIVKAGETFSFCDTVGKATPDRGYQKADIFDKDGNKVKGYGGGNCQISSTLYNAVLALPQLTIVERHEHSRKVYYVPEGKDAAVAYGSIDFKFKNDYEHDIQIKASTDGNNIYASIYKI